MPPNVRIQLFTDKEVTNWIHNKLKDNKYHKVLKLTIEEFIEQKKRLSKRGKRMLIKHNPTEALNPLRVRKVTIIPLSIQHEDSVQTVHGQRAEHNIVPFFQWTHTSVSFQRMTTIIVQH